MPATTVAVVPSGKLTVTVEPFCCTAHRVSRIDWIKYRCIWCGGINGHHCC
ncbi:hypothetical protein ACINWC136_A0051, partial [Acinetobacter pittii]